MASLCRQAEYIDVRSVDCGLRTLTTAVDISYSNGGIDTKVRMPTRQELAKRPCIPIEWSTCVTVPAAGPGLRNALSYGGEVSTYDSACQIIFYALSDERLRP